ncbi:MAG: GNAT family N-acetyltransferase [Candidatus Eisenbacteria bacterium]|nr:GNAT family N-acetyltransferase [Candidatus Eisenbacteria bacterium]
MSVNVKALEPAGFARWDDYIQRAPGSNFASRSGWKGVVESQFGCRSDWRYAERDGRVVGVLPLFEKPAGGRARMLFSAPGGLLADDEEAAAELLSPARERVRSEKLELIELRDQRRRWDGLETSEEHCTMILRLEADVDAQWKAFGFKLRNKIRKAQKSDLTTRWGPEHLPAWHRVMLENLRDLGTPLPGAGYFRAVLDAYGPDIEIEVLECGGRTIGALAAVRHADGCANPWSSSLRSERDRCPNHMLYWDAIQRAIGQGLKWFDFGRSQWNSNTFEFKRGWGTEPAPLYYQYVLGTAKRVPSLDDQKRAFALAVWLWQRLPLAAAGALGPVARRRFPEAL